MNITTKEIENQFKTWEKVPQIISNYTSLVEKKQKYIDEETLIIFTGAGTSGYIGDLLIPFLNESQAHNKYLSIYSTDIVGNPHLHLNNKKILLVSFARSGNSPESSEAILLANKYAKQVEHLVITCNENGAVVKANAESSIILPSETNDQGFAMTNSYSTMLLTAAQIFGIEFNVERISYEAKRLYQNFPYSKLNKMEFENVIYLSGSEYIGLLNELKLKYMELTNGRLSYYSEQFLNFRHGPKSVITRKSLIFIISSDDEIANKYEQDLISELTTDENQPYVVSLGATSELANINVYMNTTGFARAISLIPLCQRLAVEKSVEMGINPDNPSPSGSVNRVVQGVKIHEREIC